MAVADIILGLGAGTKNNIESIIQQISGNAPAMVDSSWIDTVSYDAATKTMRVELQDGQVYTYFNVSPELYQMIKNSDSPGREINMVLKKNFHPFVRG